MKIFALALALVAGASASSSATLPKVGGSVEVDCFQQCSQVALEGHNKKNCKQNCVVQYCDYDDDDYDDDDYRRKKNRKRDDDDDDDDDKKKNRKNRKYDDDDDDDDKKKNRKNRKYDDDDDDDDFDQCKDECRVCCEGTGDAVERSTSCKIGQRKQGRSALDDDGFVTCKQDCIAEDCMNSDGSKVADYGPCVRDCKDDCDAKEAKHEAETAESLFANGGAESMKCLDKCIAAQTA